MPRHARTLLALLVTVAAVAACSDDTTSEATGDPPSSSAPEDSSTTEEPETSEPETSEPETTTTSTTEAPEPAGYQGYADHEARLYEGTEHWICHPDLDDDICTDLRSTIVPLDGATSVEKAFKDPNAPIDCFYVYPTVSTDSTPAADLEVDASEIDTVQAQAARFGTECRVFAPAYRQISLAGMTGNASEAEREQAYADVVDAWKTYINEHSDGRGVVLIGHSQGSGHLTRLVAEEIDPDPELRELLVSALLLGSGVSVPEGNVVGGAFQEVPACETADQTGCIVAYVSYPDTATPAASGAIFGRPPGEGQQAMCVDPVALLGRETGSAVLPTGASLVGGATEPLPGDAPFVSFPDAVRTACVVNEGYSYLSVAVADAADPRPVQGLVEERLGPTWGLHLLDGNHVQDDLIALVGRQAKAYAGAG